jgi:hypothetical protein
VYGAPDFVGPIPRHFGDGIVGPSGGVGAPRTAFNPRQLQFGAKFTFWKAALSPEYLVFSQTCRPNLVRLKAKGQGLRDEAFSFPP